MDDKLKQLSLNGTNSTLAALNSTTSSLTASATATNSSVVSETTSINSSVVSPDSLGFTLVSENENTTKTISKKLGGGVSKTENETLVNGAGAFVNGSVAAESSAPDSALVPAKPAGTDADAEDEDDDEDDSNYRGNSLLGCLVLANSE